MNLHEDFEAELGSWDDVGASAMELLLLCQLRSDPGGKQRTGGWIKSGAEHGLVVELLESGLGAGNETGVGMERGSNVVDVA